ncbi:MAG TPA: hypothetical protein VGY57_06670, partial [Vicinamibacterales bacterium]|nr:hypothetical protein [Vicinamibacterales bacterium]
MSVKHLVAAVGTVAGFAGLIVVGTLLASPRVHADDERADSDEAQIAIGFDIAPVHLTYAKHNRKLVGLGSYLV